MAANETAVVKYVQVVLELGANINARGRGLIEGCTPLHVAVYDSFSEVVRFLVKQGASLDSGDIRALTPLEFVEEMAENDHEPGSASSGRSANALGAICRAAAIRSQSSWTAVGRARP